MFRLTAVALALTLTATAALTGCSEAPSPSSPTTQAAQQTSESQALTVSERVNLWFDERFEERLQKSPMQLTMLGRKDAYDQLDDFSLAAQRDMVRWLQQTAQELEANFPYEQLDSEAQTSYDLWMYQVDRDIRAFEFQHMNYVFHQMSSVHSYLPQFLISFHRVDDYADMQAYIARLEHLGQAIESLLNQAQNRADRGIRVPDFGYQGALRQARALVTGQPFTEDSDPAPLFADASEKIAQLLTNDLINAEQAEQLTSAMQQALTNHVGPAYNNLIAWLEADQVNADSNPTGVSKYQGGAEYYQFMLWYHTTTDLTAEQTHQIGLDEVARIQAEMVDIKNRVNFDGDLQDFFEFIRTDEQFFYPNTDEGRQAYLDDSKAYLDAIADELPNYFGILPKADLVVRRVEAFREEDGAAQHYFPGTPDGSRPGIYYAHLSDMSSMPKVDMESVAYHEGNPGHHMQISIAQELTGIPQFRTLDRHTVYVEGWALYSELLAKEMGGYRDDYSDFGRLTAEIWRAARLVVDTGMHALGWTEEQAVDYFLVNTPITEGSVRSEIQRYLVWPGQATAYKIGMMRIQELRAEAEQALGEQFDIRGFHDTVLGGGSLPLPILERRVRQWIAQLQETN
ncbi:MAG: DUF885 domain-containing protein [Gammaproteobacteria bacterium]|nr:DUF885 domain-containing protein [Gammaproteobacteria bacterium]